MEGELTYGLIHSLRRDRDRERGIREMLCCFVLFFLNAVFLCPSFLLPLILSPLLSRLPPFLGRLCFPFTPFPLLPLHGPLCLLSLSLLLPPLLLLLLLFFLQCGKAAQGSQIENVVSLQICPQNKFLF